METKNVIIAISSGILILIIGFALGVLYKSTGQPTGQPQNTTQAIPPAVKVLNSKTIPSITSNGIITKINGKTVTVSNQGDNVVMTTRDDAKIYSFTAADGKAQQITLQDLKTGDTVSATIKVTESGEVQAYSIVVMPPASSSVKQ